MKTTAKPKGSHSKFWALLKQTENYNEAYKEVIKESWVSEHSDGKYTSLNEFQAAKPFGYNRMLTALDKAVKATKKSDKDRQNAQRRKLMALIYTFCKHKGYACTQQQAIKIACKTLGVHKFNDATEQKLIASIKRFDDDLMDIMVDELVKSCLNNKQ